jgi:hypothetical protein
MPVGVCPALWQVFGLINIVIERMGEDITPSVQGLLPLLPQIWQDAHDQSLLRIQVGGAQPSIRDLLFVRHTLFLILCATNWKSGSVMCRCLSAASLYGLLL